MGGEVGWKGRFKCGGCADFKLYRFICVHTLAVAEHKGQLDVHLNAVVEQFANETPELVLKRKLQPGVGKKPSRRNGHPMTARLMNRTVVEMRQRPLALTSPRVDERGADEIADSQRPTTSAAVVSPSSPAAMATVPVASPFDHLGIRLPTTEELACITKLKPLVLTE